MTLPQSTIDRDIGALQATVIALTEAIKTQAEYHNKMLQHQSDQYNNALHDFRTMVDLANQDIKDLKIQLNEMKNLIEQAKGGWKVLIGVGTISAVLGGFLTKFITAIQWVAPR